LDLLVVASQQHLGHGLVPKDPRAGVLGILQQALTMGFGGQGFGVADDAGDQARHPLDEGHGRSLPSLQHEITQGNLLVHVLPHPLIKSLVAATDQGEPLVPGQGREARLVQGLALGT